MSKPDAHPELDARSVSSVPNDPASLECGLSVLGSDSLARQIAVLDGVTYAQALQQIREMMGLDLGPSGPHAMTIYNLWTIAPSADAPAGSQSLDHSRTVPLRDGAEEVVQKLRAAGKFDAISTLLDLLCEATGMRFAAVARGSDERWISCASPGQLSTSSELDAYEENCESRGEQTRTAPHRDRADAPHALHTMQLHGIERYVSVPIVMPGGHYFGNLCAIDPSPLKAAQPQVMSMFKRFAQLIGQQFDADLSRRTQTSVLFDERAASELREQFIAILGHDLRNPLQSVLASGAMLERKLTDPALVELASRIKVSARRMSLLIDDVLDFARSRLGSGIGLRLADTNDIDSGLPAVIKEQQDAHPSREIVSKISVARTVRCDIGRVQQIASNLIGNALTHGSVQSPIRVTAYSEAEEFVLTVWNVGEPIGAESLDKIFEPFWRQSTSSDRKGLGLGLHISSQIVQAHGGVLSVTSSKNAGTQFTARLPLQFLTI